AAGAEAEHRADLVRRHVPDLHAARPADAAVRAAALHHEGSRAAVDHDESGLRRGRALHRVRADRAGRDLLHAAARDLAAGAAGELELPDEFVIARSVSDEAIQSAQETGLLRFARNDEGDELSRSAALVTAPPPAPTPRSARTGWRALPRCGCRRRSD